MIAYSNFVKKFYFPLTQTLKEGRTLEYLGRLEKSQWLEFSILRKQQWARLISMLEFANQKIPYYQEIFKQAKISPSEIKNYADFRKIPLLEKQDILDYGQDLVDPTHRGRAIKSLTSGSTGMPMRTFYDSEVQSWHLASRWRGRRWFGVDIGDREVALWGRPIYSRFKQCLATFKSRLKNVILLPSFDLSPEALQKYWNKIKIFRPVYIYGYATAIHQLAQYISSVGEKGKDSGVKVIFATGETLFQEARIKIENVFECPVSEEYGCSEVGGFAYQCPQGSLHISCENVFVEFLNDNQPVSAGQIGEVVVTTLTNKLMPLIRYRIGDLGTPSISLCNCGRGLPAMELTTCKIEDVIQTKEGKTVSSKLFDYISLGLMEQGIKGIRQFKVYQKSINYFLVEIVKEKTFSSRALDFFEKKMKEFLGEDLKIEFKFSEEIKREKTGKLRYFVSEIN